MNISPITPEAIDFLKFSPQPIQVTQPGIPTMPATQESILSRLASFGTNNGEMIGGLMSGAGSLWGAYNSGQQLGLAKDAFGLQKRAFETNLANSIASYNTALEDRIRGRSSNPNEADVQAYLAANKLKG